MLGTIIENLDVKIAAIEDEVLTNVREQSELACDVVALMEDLRETKILGDIPISKFEVHLNYRSDFIKSLSDYVEDRYGGVDLESSLEVSVMQMVQADKAILGLLAMILSKRLFIIDDMEFMG